MSAADYSNGPPPPGANGNGDASPRGYRERERSRSPPARRRTPPVSRRPQHIPNQVNPTNVIGVFGLSIMTKERDLEDEFGRYGPVEKAIIVYDQRSDRSRGFGFVTMSTVEDATRCINELNGLELHGRRMRVDFSTTHKAHNPTPGQYMGIRRDDQQQQAPPQQHSGYERRGDHRHSGYERRDDRYASGYNSRRDNRDDHRRSPPRRRHEDEASPPRRRRSPSPHRQRERDGGRDGGERRRRHTRSPSRSRSPPRRRSSRDRGDSHAPIAVEPSNAPVDGGRW